MNDTTIAAKLLNQLESFLGRISPRFHKPTARFIGDMVYGIMAQKDIKLSSIVRTLKEKTTPKKVEDRLSRMLSSKGLEEGLQDAIAELGAKKVHKDTLIILKNQGKIKEIKGPFKKRDKFKRNSKCLIIVSMRMYSRSNAAYLKSSIDRRKLLIPLNITYCLPAFPTAPTNSFIAKSMLESDSAPALFRFDISFLFFFVISVGVVLGDITVSFWATLLSSYAQPRLMTYPFLIDWNFESIVICQRLYSLQAAVWPFSCRRSRHSSLGLRNCPILVRHLQNLVHGRGSVLVAYDLPPSP